MFYKNSEKRFWKYFLFGKVKKSRRQKYVSLSVFLFFFFCFFTFSIFTLLPINKWKGRYCQGFKSILTLSSDFFYFKYFSFSFFCIQIPFLSSVVLSLLCLLIQIFLVFNPFSFSFSVTSFCFVFVWFFLIGARAVIVRQFKLDKRRFSYSWSREVFFSENGTLYLICIRFRYHWTFFQMLILTIWLNLWAWIRQITSDDCSVFIFLVS